MNRKFKTHNQKRNGIPKSRRAAVRLEGPIQGEVKVESSNVDYCTQNVIETSMLNYPGVI